MNLNEKKSELSPLGGIAGPDAAAETSSQSDYGRPDPVLEFIKQAVCKTSERVMAEHASLKRGIDPTFPVLPPSDQPGETALLAVTQRPWDPVGWAGFGDNTMMLMRDPEQRVWAIGSPGLKQLWMTIGEKAWELNEIEPGVYLVEVTKPITDAELTEQVPEVVLDVAGVQP